MTGVTRMLSLGDLRLDEMTEGGIPVGQITEIVGEAGMGKTQLGIQLALQAQLPSGAGGLEKGAVYIYSKGRFPIKRLRQMSQLFSNMHGLNYDPMERIFISTPFYWKEFFFLLDKPATEPGIPGLQKIMASNEIGVIIVDSIAGYFRPFGLPNPNYQERRKVLNRISVHLRQYTEAAIVVLNEVSTAIQQNGINVPTLTTQWENHVDKRIWITRSIKDGRRQIEFGNKSVPISIENEGVRAVN